MDNYGSRGKNSVLVIEQSTLGWSKHLLTKMFLDSSEIAPPHFFINAQKCFISHTVWGGGAQWEKSNKFVPLGKMKKIIFEN
jgi:hypothetical protein